MRHVSVRAVDQLGKVGPVELLKSMCFGQVVARCKGIRLQRKRRTPLT
ncbi:hypothetical protein [Lysobacter gummosus]